MRPFRASLPFASGPKSRTPKVTVLLWEGRPSPVRVAVSSYKLPSYSSQRRALFSMFSSVKAIAYWGYNYKLVFCGVICENCGQEGNKEPQGWQFCGYPDIRPCYKNVLWKVRFLLSGCPIRSASLPRPLQRQQLFYALPLSFCQFISFYIPIFALSLNWCNIYFSNRAR